MTEPRSDDLQRSRHEAALLLRLDPQNLSPSDALRCDLVATLRLSIDSAQADALEGRAADLGRLIVATESLVKLLPSEPPQPASRGADPRQIMFETYMAMRKRGAAFGQGYDGLKLTVERLTAELAAKDARIAELEAALAESVPLPPNAVKLRNDNPSPRPPKTSHHDERSPTASAPPQPAPPPPAAASAPAPAAPQYDYNKQQDWKDWVNEDGSIRTTPLSSGKYWGPV
jgi:hypothetical protein